MSWRANTGKVKLVRINPNGSVTLETFPLDLNAPSSARHNPPMRDQNTVVATPRTSLATVLTLLRLVRDVNDDRSVPTP